MAKQFYDAATEQHLERVGLKIEWTTLLVRKCLNDSEWRDKFGRIIQYSSRCLYGITTIIEDFLARRPTNFGFMVANTPIHAMLGFLVRHLTLPEIS